MEDVEEPRLRLAVQVDEEVAARHEVEPRKRRVLQEIVRREEHHLAHLAAHAVAAVLLHEESPQPVFRDVGRDGSG